MVIAILFFLFSCGLALDWRVLQIPVADLRAIPQAANLTYGCCDDYQQTQLLYGECVALLNESDGWSQVEVPSQLYYNVSDHAFFPYPGYLLSTQLAPVPANYNCDELGAFTLVTNQLEVPVYQRACVPGCLGSDILLYLSIGTRLQPANVTGPSADWVSILLTSGKIGWVLSSDINKVIIEYVQTKEIIPSVIETAHQLLGWVYFWGGRSAYDPRSTNQLTGVDCSGLTGISHQTHGIVLPRDASGQFYGSRHGPNVPILEGTLFFFQSSSGSITHVMLYIGNGYIIESTTSNDANSTRLYPVEERYGVPVQDLKYGMPVGAYTLYWGDYYF